MIESHLGTLLRVWHRHPLTLVCRWRCCTLAWLCVDCIVGKTSQLYKMLLCIPTAVKACAVFFTWILNIVRRVSCYDRVIQTFALLKAGGRTLRGKWARSNTKPTCSACSAAVRLNEMTASSDRLKIDLTVCSNRHVSTIQTSYRQNMARSKAFTKHLCGFCRCGYPH